MIIIMLYDFIQVLNIKRNHYTKINFFTHILFTVIYLL
jgi:hypothetical protein